MITTIVLCVVSLVSSIATIVLVVRHELPSRKKAKLDDRVDEGIALAEAAKSVSPLLTSQDKLRIALNHIKDTKAKLPGDAAIRKTIEIRLRK